MGEAVVESILAQGVVVALVQELEERLDRLCLVTWEDDFAFSSLLKRCSQHEHQDKFDSVE